MGWFTRSKEIRPEVLEKCRFEIEKAPPRSALRKWVSWAVTFPFTIPEKVYNTYLLFKHKELREPANVRSS
ncbi:MAG: hypothetical protein JSS32_07105 [Verrucomicrobia bacterium]|nr:hypothetical protein [Verrucomicrobiota bacterium]